VVAVFLGADPIVIGNYGMRPAATLDEAARLAASLSLGNKLPTGNDVDIAGIAQTEKKKLAFGQKYIRGLFSGGTFCYEAQLIVQGLVEDEIFSNAPTGKSRKLEDTLHSQNHTLIDLGEDEFTVGRPHPMIDFSLRNKRIVQEARDPETAVILLDIVLGYGSHPDPLGEIVPAIKEAQRIAKENKRSLPIVASVTGTDNDPQNRSKVVAGLKDAGVLVMESNATACLLAGLIVKGIDQ
jgi:FdrA protein